MEAVRAVRDQRAVVKRTVTVVDRLQGCAENLRKEGIDLVPVFATRSFYNTRSLFLMSKKAGTSPAARPHR